MNNLIYNAIRTPDGTILESKFRHDYKTYTDKNGNEYMIDGGLDYSRRSANGDEVVLNLYDDEPHNVQSRVLKWGTRGISIAIADMSTDHINAVLAECTPWRVYRNCMRVELEIRLRKSNPQ